MPEEELKVGPMIIKESDREFTKSFKERGEFTIRIPLPFEEIYINQQTARTLGGIDVKSYPIEDYEKIKMTVTLNVVISKHPEWWESASKCPDEELLFSLWEFYLSSKHEFQERLKKNSFRKILEKPQASS